MPVLKICIYYEAQGLLGNFPSDAELFSQAQMHGVKKQNFPVLFNRLSEEYVFTQYKPVTVGYFLDQYQPREELDRVREQVIKKIIKDFTPFVPREIDSVSILEELVDLGIGVSPFTLGSIIETCISETSLTLKNVPQEGKDNRFFSNGTETKSDTSNDKNTETNSFKSENL